MGVRSRDTLDLELGFFSSHGLIYFNLPLKLNDLYINL